MKICSHAHNRFSIQTRQELIPAFDMEMQRKRTVSAVHLHSADRYLIHSRGFLYILFSFWYAPGGSKGSFVLTAKGVFVPWPQHK